MYDTYIRCVQEVTVFDMCQTHQQLHFGEVYMLQRCLRNPKTFIKTNLMELLRFSTPNFHADSYHSENL